MHFLIAVSAIVGSILLRLVLVRIDWLSVWVKFILSPLLLLTTAIALVSMGNQGSMFGRHLGILSTTAYMGSWSFLLFSLIWLGIKGYQGWYSLQHLQQLQPHTWQGQSYLLLESDRLVAAQVGFWHSQLVLSKGIFQQLSPDHINAIICHETAHVYYRDTFWFFWWAWLKEITGWLPHSQQLWTELLLFRELRADYWAKQQSDHLLLAESLLYLAQDRYHPQWQIALSASASDRLEQRIAYLLSPENTCPYVPTLQVWLIPLGLLPLLSIPFHSF